MTQPSDQSMEIKWERLLCFTLLGLALYGVYYRGFTHMGLYEDDWSAIAPFTQNSLAQTWDQVQTWLTQWPNGRPLGLSTCALAAWGLYHAGGMGALYLLPFVIVLAGGCVVWEILRRPLGLVPAFFAALAYTLLPTDTLRLSLHGAPHLHLAILCLLLAIRAEQADRSWLAAPCIFAGLLFHESSTLTAFLVPLLFFARTREFLFRSLRYWAFIFAACVTVFGLRIFVFGEARATSTFANLPYVLERCLTSLQTGTVTHWTLLRQRCQDAFLFQSPGSGSSFGIILLCLGGILFWSFRAGPTSVRRTAGAMSPITCIAFGALAMSVPYLVYFTDPYWPANHVAGRMASVHSASGVGFVFIVAGLSGYLIRLPPVWLRVAGTAVWAVPLAGLLSWGNVVRIQHLEAWQNQKAFWSQVVDHLGNIRANTVVFNLRENYWDPPFTWVIATNSWADSIVLRSIYQFPAEWTREPRVFTLVGPWRDTVRFEDGKFIWPMPPGDWPPHDIELEPGNLMIFTSDAGKPVPLTGEIELAGHPFPLMNPSQNQPPDFNRKSLFRDLLGASAK